MKKLVLLLILFVGFFAQAQDTPPDRPPRVQLQTPNNPVFWYNPLDSNVWVFKGTYGWTKIASWRDFAKYKLKSDSTAASGYTRRDRLASELAKKVNKTTTVNGQPLSGNVNLALDDISNVTAPTPASGDILKWSGTQWIPGANTPVVGGSPAFYLDPTSSFADNFTLQPAPSVSPEIMNAKTVSSSTGLVFFERFVSNPLGRSSIPAGTWTFDMYGSNTNSAGDNLIQFRINKRVAKTGMTGTWTGSGSIRTFTVTGGTPFVAGDANANRILASLIETPNQTGWIASFISSSQVTVYVTDIGYVNESNVSLSAIYYYLFNSATANITSSSPALYSVITVQPQFTVGETDRLVFAVFCSASGVPTRTMSLYYGGAVNYTHFDSPISTLHNDLAGLNVADYKHLTNTEYTGINSHLTNDADLSITNEIQNLSLSGNTLSLSSDATPVDLSAYVNLDLSGYKLKSDSVNADGYATVHRLNGKLNYRTFGTAANNNTADFYAVYGMIPNGTDLNTMTIPGTYRAWASNVCTNTPSATFDGFFTVIQTLNSGLITQEFWGNGGESHYKRTCWYGFWSNWFKVWDENTFDPATKAPAITGLTTNYLPYWDGGKFVNSLVSDDGSSVEINGNATATGSLISYSNVQTLTAGSGFAFNVSGKYYNWILADGIPGNNHIKIGVGNAETVRFNLTSTNILSTTPSTSPTTGALTVAGGLGVGGSGYFGGSLNTTGSNSGVIINETSANNGAGYIMFKSQNIQKWNMTTLLNNDFALYNNGGINNYNLIISHATGAAIFASLITAPSATFTGLAGSSRLLSASATGQLTAVENGTGFIKNNGSGGISYINDTQQTLSGTNVTWNLANGKDATITLTGNTVITITNATTGISGTLWVTNPALTYTITFAGYVNSIAPYIRLGANMVITSGGSKFDDYSYKYNGTKLNWNGTLNRN